MNKRFSSSKKRVNISRFTVHHRQTIQVCVSWLHFYGELRVLKLNQSSLTWIDRYCTYSVWAKTLRHHFCQFVCNLTFGTLSQSNVVWNELFPCRVSFVSTKSWYSILFVSFLSVFSFIFWHWRNIYKHPRKYRLQ